MRYDFAGSIGFSDALWDRRFAGVFDRVAREGADIPGPRLGIENAFTSLSLCVQPRFAGLICLSSRSPRIDALTLSIPETGVLPLDFFVEFESFAPFWLSSRSRFLAWSLARMRLKNKPQGIEGQIPQD
jgi:hypothetical protein